MLCFKEFKMMSKKKQCCFCRIVVCKTCSVKQIIDGDINNKRRTCELCDIKIRNTQVDEFYQLGVKWRQIDREVLDQKAHWYTGKQQELKIDIEVEREADIIGKSTVVREFVRIENQKKDLELQVEYQMNEKEKLGKRLLGKKYERDDLIEKVQMLRQRKANAII